MKQESTNGLCLEALEPRVLLDGTVNCALRGSTLVINGDDLDNAIQIFVHDNQITVEGHPVGEFDTTTVTGDAVVPVVDVKKIKIKMRDGDDLVGFGQFGDGAMENTLPVDLKLDLGKGDNVLGLGMAYGLGQNGEPVTITGKMKVKAGDGNDTCIMRGLTAGDDLKMDLGNGNNQFEIIPWPPPGPTSHVAGKFIFRSGSGDDTLFFTVLTAESLQVDSGKSTADGHDHIVIEGFTEVGTLKTKSKGNAIVETYLSTVQGDTKIDIRGRGLLNLDGIHHGNLKIDTGGADSGLAEDDAVMFQGGSVDGNIAIKTGRGNDAVVFSNAGGLEIKGKVRVKCGSGHDFFGAGIGEGMGHGMVWFRKPISVRMGSGDDEVEIGADDPIEATAHFSETGLSKINGGPGDNLLTDHGHTGNVKYIKLV